MSWRKWIAPLVSGVLCSIVAGLVSPAQDSWQSFAVAGVGCVVHVIGFASSWWESDE
jgi:hypothetical protein